VALHGAAHFAADPDLMNCLRAILSAFRPANRGEWSLLLTGINLMLLNFIMVQHAAVALRRAEIAVIVFSLAYFSGVSAGYFLSDRLSRAAIQRALPVFLVIQMVLLGTLQPLHYLVGRWGRNLGMSGLLDDFAAGFVLFALLAAFVTSIYAIFLPMVVGESGGDLRRGYSVEVAGSLLGLLAVPFLAGIGHEAVLGAYFATFVALAATVGLNRWAVSAMAAVAGGFLLAYGRIDRAGAAWSYANIYDWKVTEVALTKFTPYHKIEVVKADGDYRLLLNGLRQFGGDPRRTYSYFVAEYPAKMQVSPKVALLGCGSMATVGRIGDFVPSISIVDLDAEVFQAAKTYFQPINRLDQLRNWTFTADDAKHWIANSEDRFDLILHDIPPAKARQVALTYTDEFFRLVKARLTPGGVFSISSLTPVSGGSRYGKRMLATLKSVFDHYYALEHRGSVYFYGGNKDLAEPDRATLLNLVDPAWRKNVTVLTRADIDALVAGEPIITISNVGDLIYE
jgi:spermidine synthase